MENIKPACSVLFNDWQVKINLVKTLENKSSATSAPVADGGSLPKNSVRTADDMMKLRVAERERDEAEAAYRQCDES